MNIMDHEFEKKQGEAKGGLREKRQGGNSVIVF